VKRDAEGGEVEEGGCVAACVPRSRKRECHLTQEGGKDKLIL